MQISLKPVCEPKDSSDEFPVESALSRGSPKFGTQLGGIAFRPELMAQGEEETALFLSFHLILQNSTRSVPVLLK